MLALLEQAILESARDQLKKLITIWDVWAKRSYVLKGVVSPRLVPMAAFVLEGAGGAVPTIETIAADDPTCLLSINCDKKEILNNRWSDRILDF